MVAARQTRAQILEYRARTIKGREAGCPRPVPGAPSGHYSHRMAKAKKRKVAPGDVASNRYASYRFELLERIECGIALQGTEVKALRAGGAQLKDGYALVRDGELYLHNVHIPPYGPAARANHEPERDRRLLAHRRQIDKLAAQVKEKGLTLVPTRIYFTDGRAKVEIAVARGKDQYDKRQSIKERESKREMARAIREVRR